MALVRPRLNDYFNLPFSQESVDFAIPLLDEDLPLYVDPFLLWKSPSQQDNSLHTQISNSFNYIGYLFLKGNEKDATEILINLSECNEVGLGNSRTRKGRPIGEKVAIDILNLFRDIPQIREAGFYHFEEVQLLVDNIAQDRISDITCSLLSSFLIDFTIEQCIKHSIPTTKTTIDIFDCRQGKFVTEKLDLPFNPETQDPIFLVPKRWLRSMSWINYSNYKEYYFAEFPERQRFQDRIAILNFNRNNYGVVQTYIRNRENQQDKCSNDPIFNPISIISAKRRVSSLLKLPTGKTDNADKVYENLLCQFMASVLYPELDFAAPQSRTVSGVLIRDLIFYNNRMCDITKDLYELYQCRQIVMELKNVAQLNSDHIDQLNRYLKEEFGQFGIILTRNPPPKSVYKNTIDLWAGQRKCILILTDEDISLTYQLFESKQRLPIEVIKKKYVEFSRNCLG